MHKKVAVVFAMLVWLAVPGIAAAQKLVFVTRHAERADEPARNQDDPPLSRAGEQRAARLAAMLKDANVKGIYVTAFKRTQQTAAPLATALKLESQVMPLNVTAFVSALKKDHADDVVLIVAHSSTIPGIVKALTGSSVEVSESDYDSLFVVIPATQTTVRLRY